MAGASDAKLLVEPSNAVVAKGLCALVLAALCFYFLTSGRSRNEPNRLFWALICAVAILALFVF